MQLDVLFPPGPPQTAAALCEGLEPWDRGRLFVIGNMVSSVDGHVAVDGGSTDLGGEGDKALFGALRGVVDAVLAGTGTVRAEGYGRLVRDPDARAAREALGLRADPALLLLSRSGNVPWDAPVFDAPEQQVGIATDTHLEVPDGVRADVRVVGFGDPRQALDALADELGLRSVLCEGGPTINAALLDAGVLDELCVTVDPTLVGAEADAPRLTAPLSKAGDLSLEWVLRAGDELLLRYSVRPR